MVGQKLDTSSDVSTDTHQAVMNYTEMEAKVRSYFWKRGCQAADLPVRSEKPQTTSLGAVLQRKALRAKA